MARVLKLGALIPAAGRSRRMGRSKPLLPLGSTDFLGTLLQTLRHYAPEVSPVVVIHRQGDVALAERLAQSSGPELRLATVDDSPGDMLRSVRAGAGLLGEALGALVWPVDVPAVAGETLAAVVAEARRQPDRVVLPRSGDQTGHPTYVPRALLGAEPTEGAPPGLRGILATQGAALEVAVEDPWCLFNVNTPEDYARLQRDWKEGQGWLRPGGPTV